MYQPCESCFCSIFVKDWVFLVLDCFLIMGFSYFLWGYDFLHPFLLFLCSDQWFFGVFVLISGVLSFGLFEEGDKLWVVCVLDFCLQDLMICC